jgi:hypothetical protein
VFLKLAKQLAEQERLADEAIETKRKDMSNCFSG